MNPIRKWMRGAVDRRVVGALAFSAAGFIGLVGSEYFTDRAVIPIKGDRPTVGFGSTYRDDGISGSDGRPDYRTQGAATHAEAYSERRNQVEKLRNGSATIAGIRFSG